MLSELTISIIIIVLVIYFVALLATWGLILRMAGLRPVTHYLASDLKVVAIMVVVQALILFALTWLASTITR